MKINKRIFKLYRMNLSHSEYQVGRNYLETLMYIKLQKILPPLTIMKNNMLFLSNLKKTIR